MHDIMVTEDVAYTKTIDSQKQAITELLEYAGRSCPNGEETSVY